ncbi:carbon monoxide dehydrogenase [Rhodococcus sp. WMMA185]|uniref:SRPBCC family protein n=1 Tax=Rhodococcus sp. WMMA185 TaxID=679318 RepID=UPI000878516B|nr:SRPBCC family protein [Rhodococcus sp. WMMA185]AOW93356.1 carbon monoxide dehydrogenase [Rhodococcus sp. WMMA185]
MSASEIRLDRVIAAPVGSVWKVLTDLDNAEAVLSGVKKIERLDGTGYEVGTRWRETRVMFGKSATEDMWVAEVDPEKRTVVKATSDEADYSTVFTLEPTGDGTTLTMRFSAIAADPGALAKVMMKVLGPLAMRATTKAIRRDLDDIAAAAVKLAG